MAVLETNKPLRRRLQVSGLFAVTCSLILETFTHLRFALSEEPLQQL